MTITLGAGPPGPVIPRDFAGLSFERGPLSPGNAGVPGYLFSPANGSLVTLFRNMGLRSLRIGGGSVDEMPPAGMGGDGLTGIDNLFAFAAACELRVIYTLRLLSPAARPIQDLRSVNARVAGHIWHHHRGHLSSFAIGNEPDWHAFHTHARHTRDPAIYEEAPGVPGSAYPSYLSTWRTFADAVRDAAPGAPLSGPDTGAYDSTTFTPGPGTGVSWTERFAADEAGRGRVSELTQHYYVGGDPGRTAAAQAAGNILSREWVNGTAPGTQPAGTTYIPYPCFHRSHLARVAAAGLGCRLTEANDYLTGVPGASNAFAGALWALDFLHWWAAHGAAGVNFHNKQWLFTATVVPDPAAPGSGYATTPKGYAIKAFSLGSAGRVKPVRVQNPAGINVTAYRSGTGAEDHITVINKEHGAGAADAFVTIFPAGPGHRDAKVMRLASGEPGDVASARATLGGAAITGGAAWEGQWDTLPAGPRGGVSLTVGAASAAIVTIRAAK